MTGKATGGRGRRAAEDGNRDRTLAWPGDPEEVTAADIDFGALAHVLANRCRRGGQMRRYHSLAAHAVVLSEEIEALDGLADGDRKSLALHALLQGAASAWLPGDGAGSGARPSVPRGWRHGSKRRSARRPGWMRCWTRSRRNCWAS